MKLIVNKDFTKEYKNDVWRGFTIVEVISLIAALGVMVLSMYLINKWTEIPLATCVYISVPLAVPIVAIGFLKYQEMSIIQLLQEIWYVKKTEYLYYVAGIFPGDKKFSLYSSKLPGIPEVEMRQRKKQYKQRRKKGAKKWDY